MIRKIVSSTMNRQAGFSLVELMVVVAIIGVLSALAVPRFKVFQAKARQAEAKTNLSHIYTLEQSYHGDNDTFIALGGYCNAANTLGFVIPDCTRVRYTYATANITTTTFDATATSGAAALNRVRSGCGADVWLINQDKTLRATNDVTITCNQ